MQGSAGAKSGGKKGGYGGINAGRKKKLPLHMRKNLDEDHVRRQASSTSTVYVSSTLKNPDQDDLTKCVATQFHNHIKEGHLSGYEEESNIFNEKLYPILDCPTNGKLPSFKDTYDFLDMIFKAERLAPECLIMCLAYIERLQKVSTVRMHGSNWRRLILSSLILASKVWEDQAVWNVDFLSIFPNLEVDDLNTLERVFLKLLRYNVGMKASEYAQYFFSLQELSARKDFANLKPLTKAGEAKLEERSLGLGEQWEGEAEGGGGGTKKTHRRHRSVGGDDDDAKSPLVILS